MADPAETWKDLAIFGYDKQLKLQKTITQEERDEEIPTDTEGGDLSSEEDLAFDSEDESDDEELEEKALRIAIEEIYEESGKKFKPWASNAKALRIGEIILIVDSDTIVPEACFFSVALDAFLTHQSRIVSAMRHES